MNASTSPDPAKELEEKLSETVHKKLNGAVKESRDQSARAAEAVREFKTAASESKAIRLRRKK
jgi:hypothetical protein